MHSRFICLTLLLFFLLISCSTSKKDWDAAQRLDTISSYQQFMEKHPESEHVNKAQYRIKAMKWQKVKTIDTIEAYTEYLSHNPSGSNSTEAKKRIEELEWKKVTTENTIAAYEKYLFFNPNGRYKTEAHANINKIKNEAHLTIIQLEEERNINSVQHLNIEITDESQKVFGSTTITKPLFSFSNETTEVGGVKTIVISPSEGYTFLIAHFRIDPIENFKIDLYKEVVLIDSIGGIYHPLVPYQPGLIINWSSNESTVTFSGNEPFNFKCLYIIKHDRINGAKVNLWGKAFLVEKHIQ